MGYKLDDIIQEYLIEIGESQSNKHARFRQFGLNFLRETNFDISGFPTIVELDISDHDTVDLPNDYVNYTKIALCQNGKLYSLSQNNDICLDKNYDDCGRPAIANSDINTNAANFFYDPYTGIGFGNPLLVADNYRNGEMMGRMFGIGSDVNLLGSYRIDKGANQIRLSGLSISSTIVLEYLSDVSVSNDGDFTVHPFAIAALKDSVHFQSKVRGNKPLGEQQMAKDLAKISRHIMKHRFMSHTTQEWSDAMMSCIKAVPKLG